MGGRSLSTYMTLCFFLLYAQNQNIEKITYLKSLHEDEKDIL